MSKGEIIEHKGEGLYRVRQKLAVERIQQELAQVQARLAELAVELPTAKLELIHADDAVRDKAQEIDALIPDYAAGTDGALQKITALQTELIRLQSEASQQRLKVAELIAEDLANRKRQNQLEQVPEGREMDLWCADYSVELTGEVGLVDINDEGGQGTLIQPGFEDGAAYDAARDGALFPNLAQSGPQIYLNAALLPGAQKWRPRYRIGTLTAIRKDTGSVQLDPAQSSAQGLSINSEESLSGIPIQYMDCNGDAFNVGDKVLVRFTQSGPLVVGFAENPNPCTVLKLAFEPSQAFVYTVESQAVERRSYGEPFYDQASQPINPPLGTEYGSNPAWTAEPSEDEFKVAKAKPSNFGNRNWIGPNGLVLSWHGPHSRVFDHYFLYLNPNRVPIYPHLPWQDRWRTSSEVYNRFEKVLDLYDYDLTNNSGFRQVHGAAIHTDAQDRRWLIVIASDWLFSVGMEFRAYRIQVDRSQKPVGELEQIGSYTPKETMGPITGWYFNESGDQAVCTLRAYTGESDTLYAEVVAARFNFYGSFSAETIWQRFDAPAGSMAGSDTLIVIPDDKRQVLRSRNSEVSEHSAPIYVDFVGDEEVIAFDFRPEESSGLDDDATALMIGDEWSGSRGSRSRTETISYAGPRAITTSDGKTLAEAPWIEIENETYAATFDQGTTTATGSVERREILEWYPLAIDVRFGFVAIRMFTSEADVSYSASTTENTIPASGTYAEKDSVQAFFDGDAVDEVVIGGESGNANVWSTPQNDVSFGIAKPPGTYPVQYDLYKDPPPLVGNREAIVSFGYSDEQLRAWSFGLVEYTNFEGGIYVNKVHCMNGMTGYPNPIVDLWDRAPDEEYLMAYAALI